MLVHVEGLANSRLTNIAIENIQPNAVDLNLDRVWSMHGVFSIDEETKVHRKKIEIEPDEDGYFSLGRGSYEVSFAQMINVSDDEAGFVITRSTLNRNGVFVTTGLYDAGYSGSMAACLHVNADGARIKRGTRIAQYLSWKAESLHQYDGDYGHGKQMDQHLTS